MNQRPQNQDDQGERSQFGRILEFLRENWKDVWPLTKNIVYLALALLLVLIVLVPLLKTIAPICVAGEFSIEDKGTGFENQTDDVRHYRIAEVGGMASSAVDDRGRWTFRVDKLGGMGTVKIEIVDNNPPRRTLGKGSIKILLPGQPPNIFIRYDPQTKKIDGLGGE